MSTHVDLSVIIPLYNEEDNILPLAKSLQTALAGIPGHHEVVFVDDGSSDRTGEHLRALHTRHPGAVRVLRLRRNFGQTAAMAAGIERARGEVIVLMDGDLQNDPKDIRRLLEKMGEGYGVVCGWRKNRKDRFLSRRLPSRIANWLVGTITGVRIHDYGCTLKAIQGRVLKRIPLYSDMHRFIPAVASITGARVAELEVTHHPRLHGQSKYGISRTTKVLLDLITIKMIVSFVTRPAQWFGSLSIPFFILGTILLVVTLATGNQIMEDGIQQVSLILPSTTLLLFVAAFHFVAAGLLAELIVKMGDYRPRDAVTGTYHRFASAPGSAPKTSLT